MAFADPITVTVNSVAKVMPRVTSSGMKSEYRLADGSFALTISHQPSNGRVRSMLRIDQRAVVADPLTTVNDYETLSFYSVIDRPEYGFTTAQVEQIVAGLQAYLTASIVDKLVGMES